MLPRELPNAALDAANWTWADFQPFFSELLERPLDAGGLEQWLADWSAVDDILDELNSRKEVATTVNTADKEAEAALLAFARDIEEPRKSAEQALKDKLLASGLSTPTISNELKIMKGVAEIYRDENVPLFTELVELSTEFDQLTGAQTVEWQGEEVPLSKLGLWLESANREHRETAWRRKHERILADRHSYNDLWRRMHAKRQQIAGNAGFSSYSEYAWKDFGRIDYSPEDCAQFRQSIMEAVVPAAQRIYRRRAERLGLERLRPWDVDAPVYGAQPLRPYQADRDFVQKTSAVFGEMDPDLQHWFDQMDKGGLMDLFGRKNKAGGGYCTTFDRSKEAYIFMNAVGLHDDLQTLFHEAGHCFHAYECFSLSNNMESSPSTEFCEVASMGMEMLAQPYLSRYYTDADAKRAQLQHLERCLLFWPYMAVVDGFQSWCYSDKDGCDPAACDAMWTNLVRQYMPSIDFSGFEEVEATGWHRKLHIFQVPLYYVEYGLAQVGAFQVWQNSRQNPARALQMYREGLKLGSTVPLPKLFEAVGGKFTFDTVTLASLVQAAEDRIAELVA